MAAKKEDPFDCFGDNDSDYEEDHIGAISATATQPAARDPVCGVLTFHSGTEQSLRHFVQREVETPSNNQVAASKRVLQSIDQFCYDRHWMMHVGDQKGTTLTEFLKECCNQHRNDTPLNLVELGTYCGYSAILMAQTILDTIDSKAKFHIVSVDVDSNHQKVAQQMVQLANLQEYISFVLLPPANDNPTDDKLLTSHLRQHFQSAQIPLERIHFLLIDHDKDLYVADLQQLEESGWIQPRTFVAADNVVFFDIPYRSYIQQLEDQGIVSSRLAPGQLEYLVPQEGNAEAFEDGMELTVYLKDPSSKP